MFEIKGDGADTAMLSEGGTIQESDDKGVSEEEQYSKAEESQMFLGAAKEYTGTEGMEETEVTEGQAKKLFTRGWLLIVSSFWQW